jgi:hypothetical protein
VTARAAWRSAGPIRSWSRNRIFVAILPYNAAEFDSNFGLQRTALTVAAGT